MAYGTQEIHEGGLTRRVEEQTAKLPSMGYLGFAVGSMAISAVLAFVLRRKELANFVGLWAPSFLIIGLYNKLVKIEHESPSALAGYGTESRTSSIPGAAVGS